MAVSLLHRLASASLLHSMLTTMIGLVPISIFFVGVSSIPQGTSSQAAVGWDKCVLPAAGAQDPCPSPFKCICKDKSEMLISSKK